jgi:hypothetical protein
MKTTIGAALLALATVITVYAVKSEARPGTPVWGCKIQAELENKSWAVGIGVVNKAGPARITCTSLESLTDGGSRVVRSSAFVEIRGPAVGLDLNFMKREKIYMITGKVAVRDVSEMYGQSTLSLGAHANVLVIGAGAQVGVEFGDHFLGVNPSVEVSESHGLEATVSLQKMTVYSNYEEYVRAKQARRNP